ncbi:MAG TPA: acyltransferase family protein, partial [Polyangiaceae bacterium]|nr:acyltransferase family protein [Polyangiaceae bacterium]
VATDTRIDSILAGCVLAVWRNPVLDAKSWEQRELSSVWLLVGFASVAASLVVRNAGFEQTFRYTLQSFGLLPFFIAAIRFHDRHVFRILNLRAVKYLGLLSYSLYLMHTSVLWALEQKLHLGRFGQTLVALAILVALGTLIYRFIEKPCAGLRRRLSRV